MIWGQHGRARVLVFTVIYFHKPASIQPRKSLEKFVGLPSPHLGLSSVSGALRNLQFTHEGSQHYIRVGHIIQNPAGGYVDVLAQSGAVLRVTSQLCFF